MHHGTKYIGEHCGNRNTLAAAWKAQTLSEARMVRGTTWRNVATAYNNSHKENDKFGIDDSDKCTRECSRGRFSRDPIRHVPRVHDYTRILNKRGKKL